MLSTIEEHFAAITDERQQYKVRYPLLDILLITLVGVICCADGWEAIRPKHLPRYLAEFSYRFNRRFQLEDMLPRFAYIALRTPPMPNKLLSMAELYG
tara:strand:+ start:1972 stop:2265 length:294 start_codon:yes stop_codon:yes gene_type:complete